MSGDKWIVENQWRCSTCGTTNAGREMRCTGCGKPKEQEAYDASAAANAQAVTDERLLAAAGAGANWTCVYCGYQQRGTEPGCARCGATRPDAPAQTPDAAPSGAPASVPMGAPIGTPVGAPIATGLPANATVTAVGPTKGRSPLAVFGCFFAVLLVCGFGGYLFWPRSTTAEVTSVGWKVTSVLEQRAVRNGQGWQDAIPAGARVQRCEQRTNGTMQCNPYPCTVPANGQCNPHECNCENQCRDLGNGFSECQRVCQTCYDTCTVGQQSTCYQECPRIAQWCTYEYDDWRALDTREVTGAEGAPDARTELVAHSGDQRVRQDTELTVRFRDADGEQHDYHPESLAEYERFAPGQRWAATRSVAGGFHPEARE